MVDVFFIALNSLGAAIFLPLAGWEAAKGEGWKFSALIGGLNLLSVILRAVAGIL